MRVKICGITNINDARAAAEAGADAIGLNFVSGPRMIDPHLAGEIIEHLPPLLVTVALVRLVQGGIPNRIRDFLNHYRISHLQLYGDIKAEILAELAAGGFQPIPVVRVRNVGFTHVLNHWRSVQSELKLSAVVLDAYNPDREGGTGKVFRWDWVMEARESGELSTWPPIILAGGLNPDNVSEAIQIVRPFGVDVSSGVELEGMPRNKDIRKMRDFVRNAKAMDF